MNVLLISALFASLAGSNEFAAQTDTINRYVIDGQTITAFDGSQLVSKIITKYDINYKTTPDAIIKEHNITTNDLAPGSIFIRTSSNTIIPEGASFSSSTYKSNGFSVEELEGVFKGDEKPLLVVDDEVFTGNIEDINPENVKSMTVLKGKAAETVFGEKGKNGVIDIKTKKK